MTFKPLVPRPKIPQIYPVCPACGKGTKAVFGTPYAEGYYRRHQCQTCFHGFYSLASYDSDDYQTQARPYKDRELTEYEKITRQKWWEEYENNPVPQRVPRKVKEKKQPRGRPSWVIVRMSRALRMAEEDRTTIDKFLVTACEAIKKRVVAMEAAAIIKQQESEDGRRRDTGGERTGTGDGGGDDAGTAEDADGDGEGGAHS